MRPEKLLQDKGGKAAGVCSSSTKQVKAGGETKAKTMVVGGPDWERGLGVPIWNVKEDCQDCKKYHYHSSQCDR